MQSTAPLMTGQPAVQSVKPVKLYVPRNNPPNQTIYINNINEKVKKEDLIKALYSIFGRFGTILDVVVLKTHRMRGQGFIVFSSVEEATEAMRNMQGFPFYDKPIRIGYAKGKSDAVAKLDGTYVDPMIRKKQREEELKHQQMLPQAQPAPVERPKPQGLPVAAPASSKDVQPPNKILFLQNLPLEANEMMVRMLFQQFAGFREVRMVPGKPGIAFVEFENESQAITAHNGLQGFRITADKSMVITYAKK